MQSVILPSKSIPPMPIPLRPDTLSEFPLKPNKHFSNAPNSVMTDAHLNNLCNNGRLSEAIAALDSISRSGSKVRPNTFTRLIQSCIDSKSIHLGRKLHKNIHLLTDVDPFIQTKLVGMYAKCGSLEDARKVFNEMRDRNLFAWSAMIGACSRERRWREVVELFLLMMEDGIVPDEFLFPKILQACGNSGDVKTGKLIHSIVAKCGVNSETRVHNSILSVYAKCGELGSVRRYFKNMEGKDTVSWNSVITGYCQKAEIGEARRLFELMREEGVEPGLVTWNILISSYNQLGNSDVAIEMMKEMESYGVTPDVFTWTSMVSGFAQNNKNIEALELFREMVLEGVEPNGITLASAISACASLKAVKMGKELHCIAVNIGYSDSVLVGNSLIDMYSKCAELSTAREVFDAIIEKDVYTYNSMIGGYFQAGYSGKAHDLFMKMHESDVQPNVVTWNVMITGYIQNEDEDRAMDLFHRMENNGIIKRDTATWNALIAGYLQNGHKNKAIGIFRQMQSFCVRPNSVTVLSILPACANVVSAKKVKEIHGCVLRRNLFDLPVVNSFIDTYAKSGNLIYSKAVFDMMPTKDIISWNTLMAGSVLHGYSGAALGLFDHMREEGLEPNRGTFVSIIYACGLAKMVDEGERVFSSMTQDYNILPCLDHCTAMVDLYGRSGRLDEAIEFIEDMAIQPDLSIWNTLLTACRIHGNVRLALHAGEQLLKLGPGNALIQRLVLQIYALCGISDNSVKLKKPGIRNEIKESLGQSWVEIKNTVHTFVIGDKCQPKAAVLLSLIKSIAGKVKRPDNHDRLCFEEEEEEEVGGVHSEKLSLAYALIGSAQASQTIRVLKSLRMCEDCHRTFKYISKAYGREIYVRDCKCLHHIKDGHCSCADYW